MRHFSVFGAAAFACALFAGSASATQEPQAADILFERPQLEKLKGGDRLDYSYSFKSADPSLFGPAFDDRIGLRVEPGDGPDKKKVEVEMFSAERRRAAGPFEDMSGNPLLSLMLEENLQRLAAIFQANPRYMKTAIRLALRNAKATPEPSEGFGDAPGWRVEVAPFKDDPHKARMHGLDTLTYRFRVSEAAPGEITEIAISARDAKGDVLFEETTRYAGKH
ncbi:hypothetical protein GJ654_01075 [Rhodoblastus acidophilus]|uniref:DUF3108 domain-containing protein n=1 Tax=Rhodoblastus acidophilus TaxID=1074 RepID=A0A6N8DHH8_RHOAC|nr:hypothetical protein [Rhodoblastus acidophilus]MCW2272667.1 hypothetical protein [Rhodoblastus acidophilus]MTV29578.1 hypothetical protein [Rhodoblastus acidophilus]